MSTKQSVLSADFTEVPYWWQDWNPQDPVANNVPPSADVVVIGAGYAGLSCALELAIQGLEVVVIEADVPGAGASTLSGGQVSGGVNVGKKPTGGSSATDASAHTRTVALLTEAAQAYHLFERSIIDHGIECDYKMAGRLGAAWLPEHMDSWRKRIPMLNEHTGARIRELSREELREELASNIYAGAVLIERAGQIQPALYLKGLLEAAVRHGVTVCSHSAATRIEKRGAGFIVHSLRGNVTAGKIVIATNGYTGNLVPALQRRVVPVTSHQVATEELPEELAKSLLPRGRAVAETRRVTNYYRMSPDGKRMLFGGRARFYAMDRRQAATVLRNQMVERFPQMRDVKISHSWGGFVALTLDFLPHIGEHDGMYHALGCNGSGITMMSYLGHTIARMIIENKPVSSSAYGVPMPTSLLYHGKPWFMPALGSLYQLRDVIDRRGRRYS